MNQDNNLTEGFSREAWFEWITADPGWKKRGMSSRKQAGEWGKIPTLVGKDQTGPADKEKRSVTKGTSSILPEELVSPSA